MNIIKIARRSIGLFYFNSIPKVKQLSFSSNYLFSSDKKDPNDNKQQKDNNKQQSSNNSQSGNNNQPNNKKQPNNQQKIKKFLRQIYTKIYYNCRKIYFYKFSKSNIFLLAFLGLLIYISSAQQTQIPVQQFTNLLQSDAFQQITFVEQSYLYNINSKKKKIEGRINSNKFYCYVLDFEPFLKIIFTKPQIKYSNVQRGTFQQLLKKFQLSTQLFNAVVIGILMYSSIKKSGDSLSNKMGIKLKNKRFQVTKNVVVKFKDVAGMEECKRQVQQIVDFLVNPSKYHLLGATIPKGVLLTGPPGTGKTLLAKACAGEAGVPFYSVSGSDFVEVYVGVGASRVRQLFSQAKLTSPSIIFIDQLDAIGKKRMNKFGSSDQRQGTLNQLLVQMDGFGTNNSVIVIGATNRKQILDLALVRPGRFDREVQVNLPDLKGRYQIFLVHLSPLVLSNKYTKEEYAKRLASLTPGFSGAEIANLCNQAAILAARYNKGIIQMLDFELSSQRVIGGVERKGFVSIKQKRTVAFHECGHAVVSWFLEGADPLLKVTIIPRSKGALGFAQYFINENQLQSRQQLIDRICFILGGRCAQLHFFKEITTGAYDDLEKAYNLAYQIVAKFGMNTQLGYIAFPQMKYTKPYSQKIQSKIDKEIQRIIKQCTQRTMAMVIQHQQNIKNLAEQLLIKQTIDVKIIQSIIGKRPFPPNKTFEAYLQTSE